MNLLKTLFLVLIISCLSATSYGQSECIVQCQQSEVYINAYNDFISAANIFSANPTRENGYRRDFYEMVLQLRKNECQLRCGELEFNENNCELLYRTYYDKWVKKWENTHYYDSMLATLNYYMNTVFGCNVDSPG